MALSLRRKQYFVERAFQIRFARYVIFFMLATCGLTALIVFYATFAVLSQKLMGIYPEARLVQIFRSTYFALFLAFLAVTPIIFYGAVVFSHRIAGPLPKIYQALRDIGEGNFNIKVILRKNDELKDLADAINEMTSKLKERAEKQ